MRDDVDVLTKLNVKIGIAEAEGDKQFLSEALAPVLAFRRANGALVDRDAFLDQVKPSPSRDTAIESVSLLGQDRAVVTCAVSMEVEGETKRFHNVRLFVRATDGEWRLLAWANEPL